MIVPTLQRCWLLIRYGVTSTPLRLFLCHLGAGFRFGGGLFLRYFAAASCLTGRLAPCCLLTPARALPGSRLLAATRGGLLPHRALLFFRRRLTALFLLRLRRPQHGAAAVREPATTREDLVYVLRVIVVTINLVVVRHLLTGLD